MLSTNIYTFEKMKANKGKKEREKKESLRGISRYGDYQQNQWAHRIPPSLWNRLGRILGRIL